MVGGEDCLNEVSSAAAPYAATSPREISGSGVAFFLDTFSWLRKKKYLASRVKWFKQAIRKADARTATVFTLSLALSPRGRENKKHPHPGPLPLAGEGTKWIPALRAFASRIACLTHYAGMTNLNECDKLAR